MQYGNQVTARKPDSSRGGRIELGSPRSNPPEFETNNSHRTALLQYQSAEYAFARPLEEPSPRLGASVAANMAHLEAAKTHLNTDVLRFQWQVGNLRNAKPHLTGVNTSAVVSVQDLAVTEEKSTAGLPQSRSRAELEVNMAFHQRGARARSKLSHQGPVVVSQMQAAGQAEAAEGAAKRQAQRLRKRRQDRNRNAICPAYRLSPSRTSTTSTQYWYEVRSQSQHASRLRAGGHSSVAKAKGIEDSRVQFSHEDDSPRSSAVEELEGPSHLRNSFIQASRCQSKRQSAGDLAKTAVRAHGIDSMAGQKSSALGFGGRYGSRMRKRYRDKVNQKMQEIQQLQSRVDLFASMQSLGASPGLGGVAGGASENPLLAYPRFDVPGPLVPPKTQAPGDAKNAAKAAGRGGGRRPESRQMVSQDTQTQERSPSPVSVASSRAGSTGLQQMQALSTASKKNRQILAGAANVNGDREEPAQAEATRHPGPRVAKKPGTAAAGKRPQLASSANLDAHKLARLPREQQLYKLPIIKILEMERYHSNNKRLLQQCALSVSAVLANSQRRGLSQLGPRGDGQSQSPMSRQAKASANVEGRRNRNAASRRSDNVFLNALMSQRAQTSGGIAATDGQRSPTLKVSDLFLHRAEALGRGSVQRFVESAIQSKASNIIRPQDQSISLLKDLRKMQSALSYLNSTGRRTNPRNAYNWQPEPPAEPSAGPPVAQAAQRPAFAVPAKRRQLLVGHSYSSHFEGPDTIARISKGDLAAKENDRASHSQASEKPQHDAAGPKSDPLGGMKRGVSQEHGQDDEQKLDLGATLKAASPQTQGSAQALGTKNAQLPTTFEIATSQHSMPGATNHKSSDVARGLNLAKTSGLLAGIGSYPFAKGDAKAPDGQQDFSRTAEIPTRGTGASTAQSRPKILQEEQSRPWSVKAEEQALHLSAGAPALPQQLQSHFDSRAGEHLLDIQASLAKHGLTQPPSGATRVENLERILLEETSKPRVTSYASDNLQALAGASRGSIAFEHEVRQEARARQAESEVLRPHSREFYHKKKPFKHQKTAVRLHTSQQNARSLSRQSGKQSALSPRRWSLLQSKLEGSSERNVEYVYHIRREHQGLLRKALGVASSKTGAQERLGSKQDGRQSRGEAQRKDDAHLSTRQLVSNFFKKINMDSAETAAMFGPDRGRENPWLQSSTQSLEKRSQLGTAPAETQLRGRDRPRLSDALSLEPASIDKGLRKPEEADERTDYDENPRKHALVVHSGAAKPQADLANRSGSSQVQSMVDWATFGSTKEEEELINQWQQAWNMIDEASGKRNSSPCKTSYQGSQAGTKAIHVPHGFVSGSRDVTMEDPASQSAQKSDVHFQVPLADTPDAMGRMLLQSQLKDPMAPLYSHNKKIEGNSSLRGKEEGGSTRLNHQILEDPTEELMRATPAGAQKSPRSQTDLTPLKLGMDEQERDGLGHVQPTPEYLYSAKMKNESTLQVELTPNAHWPSYLKEAGAADLPGPPEAHWPGTFRQYKDTVGTSASPIANDGAKKAQRTSLERSSRAQARAPRVGPADYGAAAAHSLREGALSNDTVDNTKSSKRVLYEVQIETTKKPEDDQGTVEAEQSAQRKEPEPPKESALLWKPEKPKEGRSFASLQSKRVKIYARLPAQRKGGSPLKTQPSGGVGARAAVRTSPDLQAAEEPRPVRSPAAESSQRLQTASFQRLAPDQPGAHLHKLQYVLQTFDQQEHECQMQLQKYQSVILEGKRHLLSSRGMQASGQDDPSQLQPQQLSKCVNTYSLSDSMAEASPSLLEPKSLLGASPGYPRRGRASEAASAVQSFEVYPPGSLRMVLQPSDGDYPTGLTHSSLKKQVVYQQSQSLRAATGDQAQTVERLQSAERQEVVSDATAPLQMQDPQAVSRGPLEFPGLEAGDEAVVVKDQGHQLSTSLLGADGVGSHTTPSRRPAIEIKNEQRSVSEHSTGGLQRIQEDGDHREANLEVKSQNIVGQEMDAAASEAPRSEGADQTSPQRRESLPEELMASRLLPEAAQELQITRKTRTDGTAAEKQKENAVDVQAAQRENAPSDASFPLSPHPVLEQRLQQHPDLAQSRTSLEAYVLVSSVRVTSAEPATGGSPTHSRDGKNGMPEQSTLPRRTGCEAKWLFPQSLISESSQQQELLQVVQRYRKKAPPQHLAK